MHSLFVSKKMSGHEFVECDTCEDDGITTIAVDDQLDYSEFQPAVRFGAHLYDRQSFKKCTICLVLICNKRECEIECQFICCGAEFGEGSHYIQTKSYRASASCCWVCKKCQSATNVTRDFRDAIFECKYCDRFACDYCCPKHLSECKQCSELSCLNTHFDVESGLCTGCGYECAKCGTIVTRDSIWSCLTCDFYSQRLLCTQCSASVKFPSECRNRSCIENFQCGEHGREPATTFCFLCSNSMLTATMRFAKTAYLDGQKSLVDSALDQVIVLRNIVMEYADIFDPALLELNELVDAFA